MAFDSLRDFVNALDHARELKITKIADHEMKFTSQRIYVTSRFIGVEGGKI